MSDTQLMQIDQKALQFVSSDEFFGYFNAVTTAVKGSTFYNTADEQMASLTSKIDAMIQAFRPLAVLMTLSPAVTDHAKIVTAIRLASTVPDYRINGSQDERLLRKWEYFVLGDMIEDMQPNRVFDLLNYLIGYRKYRKGNSFSLRHAANAIGGRQLKGLIRDFLRKKYRSVDLWSIKYADDIRRLAKHLHISKHTLPEVGYLFGEAPTGKVQRDMEICRKADTVPPALWRLPYHNAKGLATSKFGMSSDEFEKKYSQSGQKTAKEARMSDRLAKEAGGVSQFNPEKAPLFELFVYLGSLVPSNVPAQARDWIETSADREAKNIGLQFRNTAVIIDTSASMYGTKQGIRHPLYRALSIAHVIRKKATERFGWFYTTSQLREAYRGSLEDHPIIPSLHSASDYSSAILNAIEGGFQQIFIIGDGYENSPEGITRRLIDTFKKNIDVDNKVQFLHLNPVHASESQEAIRTISPQVATVGVREIKGIESNICLALLRTNPLEALKSYMKLLAERQKTAKYRMPAPVRNLLTIN